MINKKVVEIRYQIMEATITEKKILLDNLYVELFDLMEEYVRSKLEIEKHQSSGQLLLAKTRYIQGTQSVGLAQIPTELNEFSALNKVKEVASDETLTGNKLQLMKNNIDSNTGHMDPLKWFSALPPSSLRLASEQFSKCVELVVASANVHRQLYRVVKDIVRLKKVLKDNAV